ncbi:MAG: sigma-70 family RNA polymerase sigma factor, partial [Brevundimonas sp.]
AEDVLQDAYVSIWNRASTFDPGRASPITWLATIARNRSIDRLRSGARMRSDRPLDAAAEVADEGELASITLEKTDDARRLNGCLDELEDKTARVIRTAFFEGLTYEALAEREGAPLGTMKSWIRRGLLRLRTCLEQ